MEPGKRLIAGDLAGSIWVYGIVVVTVAMLAWCRRYSRLVSRPAAARLICRRVPVVGNHE